MAQLFWIWKTSNVHLVSSDPDRSHRRGDILSLSRIVLQESSMVYLLTLAVNLFGHLFVQRRISRLLPW